MDIQEIKRLTDNIRVEIYLLNQKQNQEEAELIAEWNVVKSKCTHPNLPEIPEGLQYIYTHLGYGFSHFCPDCGCDCGPNDDGSSHDNGYRSGKKYPQDYIVNQTKEIKEKLRLLKVTHHREEAILRSKWDEIKLKCVHPEVLLTDSVKFCNYCGSDFGIPLF